MALAFAAAADALAQRPPLLYNRTYRSPADGLSRSYDLRTPRGYDPARRYPAVLFLPGRGAPQTTFQLAPIQAEADARGYLLVFWIGRFFSPGLWSTYYVDGVNGVPDETDVLACLDEALAAYPIDPARVHLAGFSQGGKGALLVGLKNPDRFASITAGAAPTDAFQGQLWAPSFPDFRDAAGGDEADPRPEVRARWYSQSARFLLPNARNVPVSIRHGALDAVVPDSLALFPYRNSHHVADTPGFVDARGLTPTLSELRAADPGGYAFEAAYPPGFGHAQVGVLPAGELFAFLDGKRVPERPGRVVGRHWDERARRFHWLTVGRTSPPDAAPVHAEAEVEPVPKRLSLSATGPAEVGVDLAAAGLDASADLAVSLALPPVRLRLSGPFPPDLRVAVDGRLLAAGRDYSRDDSSLTFDSSVLAAGSVLTLGAASPLPVAESDLLVPALVHTDGANGSRFETELSLANVGPHPAAVEAVLLDGSGATTLLDLPASTTRSLSSGELFALLGRPGGAAPLRLRVLAGDPRRVAASARVFNRTASGGTYGLSFPVEAASASVVAASRSAWMFAGSGARPERMNVSLFAPFGDATASVETVAEDGSATRRVEVELAPLARRQLDDVLGPSPTAVAVRVTVGSGRVQLYGTVVSNAATNDPFLSPALSAAGAPAWTVPAVAASPGRNGSVFSSDLHVSAVPHAPDGETSAAVTFRPQDGSAPRTATLSLAAGATRVVPDVLSTLFPEAVPAAGAVDVRSERPLLVFAVTRSDPETGPSSQDVPCVPAGAEATAGAPALFVGLREDGEARSNLVLSSVGPATTVCLRLWGESPDATAYGCLPLASGEVRQLPSVASLLRPASYRAAALGVFPAPGGRVVASVARIDNASNDPAGLAPVPIPPD